MSIQTWKDEFYDIEATDVVKGKEVEHSLQKWLGLRPDNLKKHGIRAIPGGRRVITDGEEVFFIDSQSCALCIAHQECTSCPLFQVRIPDGDDFGEGCAIEHDGIVDQWEGKAPYGLWLEKGDPEPMIYYLQLALQLEQPWRQKSTPSLTG